RCARVSGGGARGGAGRGESGGGGEDRASADGRFAVAGARTRGTDSVKRVIRIDGKGVKPADGDIVETEPGAYSILVDGKAYEARLSGEEIVVNGRRFEFDIEDPRAWNRTGGSA